MPRKKKLSFDESGDPVLSEEETDALPEREMYPLAPDDVIVYLAANRESAQNFFRTYPLGFTPKYHYDSKGRRYGCATGPFMPYTPIGQENEEDKNSDER